MDLLVDNYWIVFLTAGGLYAAFYLGPLLAGSRALKSTGLDDLVTSLRRDLAEVVAERTPHPDDPPEHGGDAPPVPARQWAAERLGRLDGLQAQYQGAVQEAVDQVRVQYPDGAYQHFEIERLPAVAAFSDRVGSARTMAGVFVLLGLLFTMVRLNGVVGGIAAAASGGALEPAEFLAAMGELMDGIGGAFDSSIWGLGLLVVALTAIGLVDWRAQRRVQRLETETVQKVLPILSELHKRLMPNLTTADLLAETGRHLQRLSGAVSGLTGELDVSLDKLGDRIGSMMDDFRSFQDQYAKLDDLLGHLRKAGVNLGKTTGALEGAANRIVDPLTTFNKTLLTHVETVVDWVDVSRTGFAQLSNEMAGVREHTDRLVEGLARAAETGFGEGLASHRATLAALDRQTGDMQRHLAAVAEQFDRAAGAANGHAPAEAL